MADERRSVNLLSATGLASCALMVVALALFGCGNEPGQGASGAASSNGAASASARTADDAATNAATNAGSNAASDASASATEPADDAAPASPETPPGTSLVRVMIGGEAFDLEPAVNQTTRYRGLGGRASLPERGGMIFAFPFSERLEFVMRDCLMDIDIAYLNNDGRVLSMHTMINEPREPGESDSAYEQRLTRYPSRFPARFAVEVRAGLLRELGLQVGDVIEFDRAALKARAR